MNNRKKKIFKVGLIGASLNTGNRGVSALAASLVKIIKTCEPESEISFFIGSRSADPQIFKISNATIKTKTVNFRLSPRANIQEHLFWIFLLACFQKLIPIKRIKEKIIHANTFLSQMYISDLVGDIRGGDSFSDIYGILKFVERCIPALIAIFLNKKLTLLPQTYGPYNSRISKVIASYIISKSFQVLSRDRTGVDFIKNFLKNRSKNLTIGFCPDVAFMLDSIKPDSIHIEPSIDMKQTRLIIGFNVSGLMYNGGYTKSNMFGLKFDYKELIVKLLEILLQKTKADILLIPHTFGPPGNINSDPDACKDVMKHSNKSYKNKVHMVVSEYNQSEIKGIIGLCDFFIGSRMHACIAALSQGIPTVGIAYSKKFLGVFDSIGSGNTVIDARSEDEESIISKILESFYKRDEISVEIIKNVDTAQRTIMSTFKKITSF